MTDKKHYVYSLNLKDEKKYVGMTSQPQKRINDHFSGNGSEWCKKHQPVSINHIQECKNYSNAKKAETIVYYNMKKCHGSDSVRGAGHTRSY